jgi:hypothetical protein
MVWAVGLTFRACGGTTVIVIAAVAVVPALSLTVRVTVPEAEPVGTITLKVWPLAATVGADGGNARLFVNTK